MTAVEPADTTGADLLVKALIDEDVEVVFGYPGGAVLPISGVCGAFVMRGYVR